MVQQTRASERDYREESHAINARDVHFDFSSVPMHYIPGEVLATHIINVMHLVLPEGERAMAQALGEALPYIDDERLREEVAGFVGQEAMHANSHEGARKHLQSIGLDVDSMVEKFSWLVDRVLGDHGLTGRAKEEWLKERLGLFAGMEHYTAVIGEWLLDNDRYEKLGMDPTMLDLIRWHGAEEVEHRSVVYDAYMHVDGGYLRKARTALVASTALLATFLLSSAYLYAKDPTPKKGPSWPWQFLSATARGVIPKFTIFATEIPRYLRPGFHPSQLGSMDKALRYLAHSPAARAGEPGDS
ncbi:metal-dependent hydrolase [Nocardia donostiensis]|uniref:Metal-dependent hydrolase n=1 Tax=Nocardia donostiensis TaxID=1538463 RepID=A0A1W0B6U3_9NOCA|nr:metal-dependent hydrolase [Nocardia donostiensis]ONM46473.1 metal-dependent hydrolase [Nocardia donostiensis]OQS14264.1 metal-dependent hydrolase [Nocardia donostiensis]OQS18126.1 metal-dependent hydrolase [Nocardia donostiensis]